MKKFINSIAMLVAVFAAASCVQEEAPVVVAEQEAPYSFSANFSETPEAKATLEPGVSASKVRWTAGDSVKVFADANSHKYKAATSDYSSELNFVKQSDEEVPTVASTYYAVHPFTDAATCSEGVITTTLPAVQYAVKDNFTHHLAVAKTTGSSFSFKNVCGLVRVDVQSDNVVNVVLQGKNDEYVAGGVNVTVSDTPTWTTEDTKGSKTITLVPAEGQDFIEKGVYFFAVLPQTFENGFSVKTVYGGGVVSALREVNTSITIERGQIVKGVIGSEEVAADETEGEGTEASPYLIKTKWDLVRMRLLATPGQATYFKLENNIDMAEITEWIPVNYDSPYDRQIFFDGNDKTLSNFSCNYKTYPSLFGVLYGSCKNLNVDNAVITSTSSCGVIGGYVGTSGKEALVENVTVTNSTVTNSGDRAGGICGTARQATFNNVSFQGKVISTFEPDLSDSKTNNDYARSGGFVGFTQTSATFRGCSVDVTVEAVGNAIGGFVGYVTGTNIFTDCIGNKATVTSTYIANQSKVGGFVGAADNGQTFTNCDADVTVTVSQSDAGGFAGYLEGESQKFTGCDVKTTLVSKALEKNRCGGFIGWNRCIGTTIENCHVLDGSTITDESGRTASKITSYGGFIGYADSDKGATKLTVKKSSAKIDVDSGDYAQVNSCFIGSVGYASEVLLEDCSAEGNVVAGLNPQNYAGGLIARVQQAGITGVDAIQKITITNCSYKGNVTGRAGVGGLVGSVDAGELEITASSVKGVVKNHQNNIGGIIGLLNNAVVSIDQCSFDGTVDGVSYVGGIIGGAGTGSTTSYIIKRTLVKGEIVASNSYAGGLVGAAQSPSQIIENCFGSASVQLTGTGKQIGGLVGTATSKISITNSVATGNVSTNTVAGGIIGRIAAAESKLSGCIAWNASLTANKKSLVGAVVGSLEKSGDYSSCIRRSDMTVTNSSSALADQDDITTVSTSDAYHGKAAAAGETASQVAQKLGWDTTIWDLSGTFPVLK